MQVVVAVIRDKEKHIGEQNIQYFRGSFHASRLCYVPFDC